MNPFNRERVNGLPLYLFRIALGLFLSICTVNLIEKVFLVGCQAFSRINIPYFECLTYPSAAVLGALLLTSLALSLMVTIGYHSKSAFAGIALIWLYLFLLHLEKFNNHYYLLLLILILMAVTDAGKGLSVTSTMTPSIPKWNLNILRFQCAIPYFFSGLQKVNNPDWFDGFLLVNRLSALSYHSLFHQLNMQLVGSILAKCAITFDLSIGFLLLNKKTRPWAAIIFISFHLINHFIIFGDIAGTDSVGIFPYLGIITLILFFDGDEIATILTKIKSIINQVQFWPPHNENNIASKSIIQPYLVSIIMIIVITLPAYRYINYSQTLWNNAVIGTWNNHTLQKSGSINVYYQHNQTGIWVLFPPPQSILPPNLKALKSPKGHHALIKYIKTKMELLGLYVPYIGFQSEIVISNRQRKSLQGILHWEEITEDRFEKEFTKSVSETRAKPQ